MVTIVHVHLTVRHPYPFLRAAPAILPPGSGTPRDKVDLDPGAEGERRMAPRITAPVSGR